MAERRDLVPTARRLVKLAAEDRAQARAALSALSLEEQVATVCEAPLATRSRLLDLVPSPEQLIPLLPPAELCFTCKHVGVHDASALLAHASDEQIVTCLDLDAWQGLTVAPRRLDGWLAALAEAGDETLLRAARSMDPELLSLYVREHAQVVLKPAGDEDWQPPEGAQTLEGQFYLSALSDGDDLAPLLQLIHVLFQKDYWLYFRIMQSVEEELPTETEEWALRWRNGRLEDLGFPSWDRSMRIYGHLRPDRLDDIPPAAAPVPVEAWSLPVWITELPATWDARHGIFAAVAGLDAEERASFFYAFVSLANMVAVADRRDLGDAETLPITIEKAARLTSLGLEHLSERHGLRPEETLRRVSLERLFRVGVNLSPDDESPGFSDEEDEGRGEDERRGEDESDEQ